MRSIELAVLAAERFDGRVGIIQRFGDSVPRPADFVCDGAAGERLACHVESDESARRYDGSRSELDACSQRAFARGFVAELWAKARPVQPTSMARTAQREYTKVPVRVIGRSFRERQAGLT